METLNRSKASWCHVDFGSVVELSKARSRDPIADGFERYVGLEHLEPGELRIRNWGLVADGTTFTSVFTPGQVLFGKRRAYQGKVAIADFSGVCSGDIYVLQSKDASVLIPGLVPFICQTEAFFQHAVGTSAGSLSPRTNWNSLSNFRFVLPPMEEQQRMLRVLEALERCAWSAENLARSTERLRRAFMVSHFEGDYANYNSVSQVGTWHSGGTPSRAKPEYWNGPIPWVSPKDMKVSELKTTEETLTQEGVNAGSKLMPADTIMIVVRGMILAHTFPVARTLVPAAFNQDMKALIVSEEYRPQYVQCWFEYASPRYLQLVSDSSHGTKRLESEKLFSLKLPIISLREQDEFVTQVEAIRATSLQATKRKIDARSMKRHFLTNLVPEDE